MKKMILTLFAIAGILCAGAEKMERKPLPLSPNWIVFMKVREPKNYQTLPVTLTAVNGGTVIPYHFKRASTLNAKGTTLWLNWFAGQQYEVRDRAILYNEFESEESAEFSFGYSADWFSKLYLNGELLVDCMEKGNGGGSYVPNDHPVKLKIKKGTNLLAAVVEAGSAGWRFTWGVPSPQPSPLHYRIGREYQALDLSKVTVTPGSALDLSSLTDAPAGKYGRIIRRKGQFAYEKAPEKTVRLFGFNNIHTEVWYKIFGKAIPRGEFEKNAKELARAIRAQGYNYVRLHGIDLDIMRGSTRDLVFDPESMDRWDFLLAEFKKQGIYVKYVVFSYNFYGLVTNYQNSMRGKDMHRLMFLSGRPFERERFVRGMRQMLQHVNPYTGLAWKNDPVIAVVDIYNEEHAGHLRVREVAAMYPQEYRFFVKRWGEWLKKRYAGRQDLPSTLRKNGFSSPPVPRTGHGGNDLIDDYGRFLYECAVESNTWAVREIRKTGYQGLITNCHCTLFQDIAASWSSLPTIDAHTYFMHPSQGSPQKVDQQSSISQLAGCFTGVNSSRLAGRPFSIGEYLYTFWNRYQYEQPLTFGAYAALNRYSSLEIYSLPVQLRVNTNMWNEKLWAFNVANSGVLRGGEFITAMLFKRGDVTPAPHRLHLLVPQQFLSRNGSWLKAVNSRQNKLALLSDFSLVFPDLPLPEGESMPERADLSFLPAGVSEVNAQEWFTSVVESPAGEFSMDAAVKELRKKGILPPGNVTNPARGVYQSETGELTLFGNEKKMTVITRKTEAVARPGSASRITLDALTVKRNSADAMIAATSIDNLPLEESKRVVLVISTDNVNNGMKMTWDRSTLIDRGKPPVLYRTGEYEIVLRNRNASFRCYALNLAGDRKEELPVSLEKGRLLLRLDTSALKNGPTPFFELVSE